MSDELLDNDLDKIIPADLRDCIWKNQPKNSLFEVLSQLGSYHGILLGFSMIAVTLIVMFSSLKSIPLIAIFILIALFVFPVLFLQKLNSYTQYYILKKGIYLTEKDWKWQSQVLFIPFDNIRRIDLLRKGEKAGDLVIITKDKQITPSTLPSEHPSMLGLEDVKKVAQIIHQNLSE